MKRLPIADPSRESPVEANHRRHSAVALHAMAATSQPLATHIALGTLRRGGNAVDAALAAVAALGVLEPMWSGVGGDCFAIVWDGEAAHALDAAGPAPARAAAEPVEERGPRSVTVPGSVAGWAALSKRFGRLGLDTCLEDAIEVAERGFAVSPIVAWHWRNNEAPEELGPVPAAGEPVRMPDMARTLRRIADSGPSAFYRGDIARAIASSTWLDEDDLARFEPRWIESMQMDYRGHRVLELPPPTQGVAALEGLGLLEGLTPGLPARIEAVRLALEDAHREVRDGADVRGLLEPDFLARRRAEAPGAVPGHAAETVYVCVVDGEGMAVSLIQSLFMPFGSRVVAPGTGIILQNRGAGFRVQGRVEPGRRPFHTNIPAMILRDGALYGVFGIVGGPVQAQAHVQFVSNLVDDGLDPQTALDRPRFSLHGDDVRLEAGLWHERETLERLGIRAVLHRDRYSFGGGQAIVVGDDCLVGGSDSRKDGIAAGF